MSKYTRDKELHDLINEGKSEETLRFHASHPFRYQFDGIGCGCPVCDAAHEDIRKVVALPVDELEAKLAEEARRSYNAEKSLQDCDQEREYLKRKLDKAVKIGDWMAEPLEYTCQVRSEQATPGMRSSLEAWQSFRQNASNGETK